jgi:hypothetical protein
MRLRKPEVGEKRELATRHALAAHKIGGEADCMRDSTKQGTAEPEVSLRLAQTAVTWQASLILQIMLIKECS